MVVSEEIEMGQPNPELDGEKEIDRKIRELEGMKFFL